MRRHWRLAAVALGVLLVAGLAWASRGALQAADRQWLEVQQDDLVLSVELEGSLKAVDTTLISPPQLAGMWQFKVAYMAPEGEIIESGKRVLAFDDSQLRQRLQQEMAERDAAQKRVEKREKELEVQRQRGNMELAEAEAQLRRAELKSETPDQFSAASELQEIRLDLELAQKRVDYLRRKAESSQRSADATIAALRAQASQAEQTVEETEQSIERMVRLAPKTGTVIYVTNWREEKKKVGDTCWRGEDVIELPDLNRMQASGRVHEADAGKVAKGQKVKFRLDAHPDVEFSGTVESIWRTVQTESWRSKLKVVKLEIELDETDTLRMRPGMRLRGRIETDRVADALVVDADAVFAKPEGPVAFRKTLLGYERVPLELGRRNETRVEILGGLSAGDQISTQDLEPLTARAGARAGARSGARSRG